MLDGGKITTSHPNKMTLGEIIKEWIDGHLGEGFKFEYNGQKFVITDDQIRTVDTKMRGDYSSDFEDLFEWIDSNQLDEEVKIINYVYRIKANVSDISGGISAYSHSPNYNYYYSKNTREVRCCPVCGGNGLVSNGFYNHTGGTWITSTTAPEQCRSCKGKGYIEI